jgi:hypothetical protein
VGPGDGPSPWRKSQAASALGNRPIDMPRQYASWRHSGRRPAPQSTTPDAPERLSRSRSSQRLLSAVARASSSVSVGSVIIKALSVRRCSGTRTLATERLGASGRSPVANLHTVCRTLSTAATPRTSGTGRAAGAVERRAWARRSSYSGPPGRGGAARRAGDPAGAPCRRRRPSSRPPAPGGAFGSFGYTPRT